MFYATSRKNLNGKFLAKSVNSVKGRKSSANIVFCRYGLLNLNGKFLAKSVNSVKGRKSSANIVFCRYDFNIGSRMVLNDFGTGSA